MKNEYIDAVITATSIHKGDFSFLRGKEFKVRDKIKNEKERGGRVKKPKKNNTISERVERLENKVDQLGTTVNKLGITVNKLGKTVNKLAKIVETGFSELRQDIKDINARLDYNDLQIEGIQKRLDYNGLKKLPNKR